MSMFTNFDFDVVRRALPYLFYEGMTFTLTLTALSAIGGIVLGTLIALMRLSSSWLLGRAAALYVDFIRSLPLVLVIFWFYFLVPYIGQWITGSPRPIKVALLPLQQIGPLLLLAVLFLPGVRPYLDQFLSTGQQIIGNFLEVLASGG